MTLSSADTVELLRHCVGYIVDDEDDDHLGYVVDLQAGDDGRLDLVVQGRHETFLVGSEEVHYVDPHEERIAVTPEWARWTEPDEL